MKFAEINKRYTEIVTDYINRGYTIHTGTMSGSQGDIAKIDLTDGKEIIRIVIYSNYTVSYHVIGITVGKATDNVRVNDNSHCDIIWNQNLNIIAEYNFYEIGNNSNWYGTKEDANKQHLKAVERMNNRHVDNEKILSEYAKTIACKIINKKPKCKSIRLKDIECVWKEYYPDESIKVRYFARAKLKTIVLNG